MFRFTIRDVLWLMLVVGLSVGWLMDRNALSAKIKKTTIDEFEESYSIIRDTRLPLAK